MPQPDNCPTQYRATDCSYGPLAQVTLSCLKCLPPVPCTLHHHCAGLERHCNCWPGFEHCVLCLQLDRRLTDRDWRWHLERSYTLSLANGQVDMFFIDTSPFVQEYQTAVWSVNEGELIPPASDQSTPCAEVSANKMPARLSNLLLLNFERAMSKASIASLSLGQEFVGRACAHHLI